MTHKQDKSHAALLPPGALPGIARIVLLYALFASLWILLSDRALGLLFADPATLQTANTLKGLLFVAVTSVLLFFLVLRFAAHQNGNGAARAEVGTGGTPPQAHGGLFTGIVLFSVAFVLLGGGAILQNAQRHRLLAGEHLASVAQLKKTQVETWLEERRRDAEIVRTALLLGELLPAWRQRGDATARTRLLARMEDFRTTMRYAGIALHGADGAVLLEAGSAGHAAHEVLDAAVRQAIADGKVRMTDLFRMETPAPAHIHLDFVVPLPPVAGTPATAVVLRVDLDSSLQAYLRAWPLPSNTSETILFRRDGESVLPLTELRHAPQAALQRRMPITRVEMLAVQALAPGYRPGSLLAGEDYRGEPVLGAAYPIEGTSWWLLAKTDRDEIFREANTNALWIGFASFLTWLVAVIFLVLFYKQRELQHAEQQRAEQAERLRALQLLEAIANGSTDAIFAKDARGRYLLFNNEAARVTGKPVSEVLGRDDRVLFPAEQAELVMANDRQVMTEGVPVTFQERLDTADGAVVFLATKGPLRDAAGQCIGLFGISRDISKLKQIETALQSQTEELQARNAELERFNRAMVDREFDMIELKKLVNALSHELGRTAPFSVDFLQEERKKP